MEVMTDKRPTLGALSDSAQVTQALRAAREAVGSSADVERLRVKLESSLVARQPGLETLETTGRLGVLGAKTWPVLLAAAVGVGVLAYWAAAPSPPAGAAAGRPALPVVSIERAASVGARSMNLQPPAANLQRAAGEGARGTNLPPPAVDLDRPARLTANGMHLQPPAADFDRAAGLIASGTHLPPVVAIAPEAPTALAGNHAAAQSSRSRPLLGRPSKPAASDNPAVAHAIVTAARVDPDAEIALVTRAQLLLSQQPNTALALLLEHEQRFPHGILVQERDTLRIDAERALGQNARAREHARTFVAQFPKSPSARALKQWLAVSENGAADHNAQGLPVLTP